MRRNIVGGLVAAVGLVLLGTASSFASGMGHKPMHTVVLNVPAVTPAMKAEVSPEPSDTPEATPTSNPGSVMLNMNGIKAGTGSDDSSGDDSSTHTAPTSGSGDDHSSSGDD
jgi:hypothetical protein